MCWCIFAGVTQDLIDETRLSTETNMLDDLKYMVDQKGDLEIRGRYGETSVCVVA